MYFRERRADKAVYMVVRGYKTEWISNSRLSSAYLSRNVCLENLDGIPMKSNGPNDEKVPDSVAASTVETTRENAFWELGGVERESSEV